MNQFTTPRPRAAHGALALLVTAAFGLAGCGGGGGGSPAPNPGSATFRIAWPTRSRIIPRAANSIKIDVRQGTSLLASRTVERPAAAGETNTRIDGLAAGALTAVVTAHPEAAAAGTVQASASIPVNVASDGNTTVTIDLQSTIDRIELSPGSPAVTAGGSVQLTATPRDTAGNAVLVLPDSINWASETAGTAGVNNTGLVSGLAAGPATIRATESESGKTAAVSFNVSPPAGPGSVAVKLDVNWPARSRAVSVPSSAQSLVFTLKAANPDGSDLTFTANRGAQATAHTANYTTTPAKVGTWEMNLRAFAEPGGAGALVGRADATVTIAADGTGVPDISLTGTVVSVVLPISQSVKIGTPRDLTFYPKDSTGAIVLVSPPSAIFSVTTGSDKLRIVNGFAEGLALGTAVVTATIDGKTSAAGSVLVVDASTPGYTIVDVGSGDARDINASGQIAGTSHNTERAFRWQSGVSVELPPLPGYTFSEGLGINDAGTVVGFSSRSVGGNLEFRATLWDGVTPTDLGVLPGGVASRANAINNNRQIVGISYTDVVGEIGHAFRWENGVMTDLGVLGGSLSEALDINDSGHAVGYSTSAGAGNPLRATLWSGGAPQDLGILAGDLFTMANGINNSGVIVGASRREVSPGVQTWTAFRIQGGTMESLSSVQIPEPFAIKVNATGVISISGFKAGALRAGVYLQGQVFDLNGLTAMPGNLVLRRAFGLNDAGALVGEAYADAGGAADSRAFMAVPQ